jgi:hypothetical protein
MTTTPAPRLLPAPPLARVLARARSMLRTDAGLFRLGVALIALHVLDDNYLQPQPGTSPGDHLVSGLVPLAVLALVA